MTKSILMGVSALAILAAVPALAETSEGNNKVKVSAEAQVDNNADRPNTGTITSDEIEQGVEDAGDAIGDAARNVGNAVEDSYRDMRNFFQNKDDVEISNVTVAKANTANGIIGQPILDMNEKKVGTVHDIIVDGNGDAQMIVVSDGGLLGIGGKLAAFDYGTIVSRNEDGDVISTLTEETLDRVAEFSYEAKAGENVRVIPSGGYSVKELLNAQLLNPQGESVAEVENISFANARADLLIVAFNKVLGLGGEKAALNYSQIDLTGSGKDADFRLTQAQTARFESHKEAATN